MPLAEARFRRKETRRAAAPTRTIPRRSTVPYEYAASFKLTGRPGNIVEDVINISPEGVFIAVAIGYGFEEERGRAIEVPRPGAVPLAGLVVPGTIELDHIPQQALIEGFRVNQRLKDLLLQPVPGSLLSTLFERLKPPEDISFLFSFTDSGTGRELQDQPVHNLASLGKSNGERPFRPLAQPLSFLPRSTIRLQVIERSEGAQGTLFIVLFGYKLLAEGCPEVVARALSELGKLPAKAFGRPSPRIIPFDYVATFDLTGTPGNIVEDEISINVEGGFVATSLGYGLAVPEADVKIQPRGEEPTGAVEGNVTQETSPGAAVPVAGASVSLRNLATNTTQSSTTDSKGVFQVGSLVPGSYEISMATPGAVTARLNVDPGFTSTITIVFQTSGPPRVAQAQVTDLAQLPLHFFAPDALIDGIRIRPGFLRVAFQDNGSLAGALPRDLVDRLFERLNRVEDVSFRYMIFDTGTGRDWQNQPIHNVAGLGIANGDRPFKKFARPMFFLPRSTIRVRVEERFGRGRLFLVFQGYKILEAPPLGGGA